MKTLEKRIVINRTVSGNMAMIRPEGKARKIADQVVPGLISQGRSKKPRKRALKESFSEVELIQTTNIDNKKRIK